MSTFQFDTSGVVKVPIGDYGTGHYTWEILPSDFVRGYFHAIAREAWETLSQIQKDRLDHFGPIAFSDFSPELVGRGMRDCEAETADWSGPTLEERDGDAFWRLRQRGARSAFPALRLVIAEDGLLHSEERK